MGSWILQYLTGEKQSANPAPADATATKLPRQLRGQPQRTIGPTLPGNHTPSGLDKAASFVEGSNGDTAENWILNYLTPVGAMRAGAHLANTMDTHGLASGSTAAEAAASSLIFLPEGAVSGVFKKLLGKSASPFERFAVLTAENPGGKAAEAAVNAAGNARLEAAIRKAGYKPIPTVGRYPDEKTGELLTEHGFMVPNMPHAEAEALGRQFKQNSVLTDRGLHDLVDNKVYPATGLHPTGAGDVAHTELPNGKKFSMDLNFNDPVRYFDHYSSQPNLNELDPAYMGSGQAGAEKVRGDRPQMSHVYAAGTKPEPQFAKLNKYSVAVQGNLYDVAADPDKIVAKVRQSGGGADAMERAIQKAGYAGYNNGEYYPDTYKLFGKRPVERADLGRAATDSVLSAALTSVGVRPKTGFGGYQSPASVSFEPKLSSLLSEADTGPHPTSDAARAAVRPPPMDMEIPVGLKSPNSPAVLTAPNTGDVFDTSKLGLNVPAGVSTDRPPLKRPVRADLSSLKDVPRKFREVYTPNAEKAMRETPEAAGWYDMSPVRDAMSDLSPEGADDFKKFMLFMGPTSIGTQVPMNLRQASKLFQLYKNGELNLDVLKNGVLDLPMGYANRRQKSVNAGIAKILENGNLDPFTTPKTYRYANQLAGDGWGGAALDMHVGRQVGKRGLVRGEGGTLTPETGFPSPGYSPDKPIVSSSPSDTQYAHIEDALVRQASNLGLTPSQYQALGWVGGGAQTGISDTRPLLSIFNQKLRDTAARYGYNSPLDAFTAFAQGKTPLWAMLGAAGLGGGLLAGNDQQR